jgi:hypothetical protein
MKRQYDVIQIGLGPMGKIIAELMLKRKNINLKAVIDIDPILYGKSLNEILNIEQGLYINVDSNIDKVLSEQSVDVVFIATSSSLENVAPIIKKAIRNGSNVISLCEELSYPFQKYPKISEELDKLAKSKDLTIVGTGINPGYLMDLLPIIITAPCQIIESIKVIRMMNSTKRREPFQRKIGTGLTPNEFHKKISNKEISGHVGLTESINMICSAIGFEYDELIEFPALEIIAEHEFTTSYGEIVPKDNVCGLRSKAIAKFGGKEIIELDFIAFAEDHEEYDEIIIKGTPPIHQKIIGGVHGDLGTAAIVVNIIPNVVKAKAGLLTMKDLPVPCNTERIWNN